MAYLVLELWLHLRGRYLEALSDKKRVITKTVSSLRSFGNVSMPFARSHDRCWVFGVKEKNEGAKKIGSPTI